MPDAHRIDLPQGTLDLPILPALAPEPQQGWAMTGRAPRISRDVDAQEDWVKLTAAMAPALAAAREIPAC